MISLGAIESSHSIKVDFSYLVAMDLRKTVRTDDQNDFLGETEESFYELLIPVCFKPKYASLPTGDSTFVTGAGASSIRDVKSTITVKVFSSNDLELYDQSSSARNNGKLLCDKESHDGRFTYTYCPDPESMGDVFLKIMNTNNSISTGNSDKRGPVDFESEKVEARLFKFSDVLKPDNPLFNKYGLVVDYAIKRKMMHKVI